MLEDATGDARCYAGKCSRLFLVSFRLPSSSFSLRARATAAPANPPEIKITPKNVQLSRQLRPRGALKTWESWSRTGVVPSSFPLGEPLVLPYQESIPSYPAWIRARRLVAFHRNEADLHRSASTSGSSVHWRLLFTLALKRCRWSIFSVPKCHNTSLENMRIDSCKNHLTSLLIVKLNHC